MSYAIEHDIPIPPKRVRLPAKTTKYDFSDMEIGDSFSVPLGDEKRGSNYVSALRLTSAATNYKRRHPGVPGKPGWDFTVRTLGAEQVVRIWRTA